MLCSCVWVLVGKCLLYVVFLWYCVDCRVIVFLKVVVKLLLIISLFGIMLLMMMLWVCCGQVLVQCWVMWVLQELLIRLSWFILSVVCIVFRLVIVLVVVQKCVLVCFCSDVVQCWVQLCSEVLEGVVFLFNCSGLLFVFRQLSGLELLVLCWLIRNMLCCLCIWCSVVLMMIVILLVVWLGLLVRKNIGLGWLVLLLFDFSQVMCRLIWWLLGWVWFFGICRVVYCVFMLVLVFLVDSVQGWKLIVLKWWLGVLLVFLVLVGVGWLYLVSIRLVSILVSVRWCFCIVFVFFWRMFLLIMMGCRGRCDLIYMGSVLMVMGNDEFVVNGVQIRWFCFLVLVGIGWYWWWFVVFYGLVFWFDGDVGFENGEYGCWCMCRICCRFRRCLCLCGILVVLIIVFFCICLR